MKHLTRARLTLKPKRFTTIVMMLIIWAGVAGALFAGFSSDLRNREYLLGRAQTIAAALPIAEIKDLHGNQDDLTSLSYNDLKSRLQHINTDNRDIDHISLVHLGNDRSVSYADSESPGSTTYLAPGAVFAEGAQNRPLTQASNGFVAGPLHVRGSWWISAYAPITDPKTDSTLAIVAVDSNAYNYYLQIILYSLVPLLLAAIPFAGLLRDIKLRDKEQEILQLKNQFVSIASHELRSPLAGMLWAIQSLSKDASHKLTLHELGLLSDMYRSTESSLTTVNEILDLSIFERGQSHKLQHDLVDMGSVIKQVAATLTLGAQEKHIAIEPVGEWPAHITVLGDVGALKRALMNIISNAIKYSPERASIEIAYQASPHEHIISIKDHGIGIPEAEQSRVIEGYYRASNATRTESHGTGLGLWLTKRMVEEHGGRLWLDSKLNQGTTIYLALPKTQPTNPGPVKSADPVSPVQDLPSTGTPLPQTEAPR